MNFTLENFFFYFISANAVILSALLILSAKKNKSKKWLGLLLLAFAFNIINHKVFGDLYLRFPNFTLRAIPTLFSFGPIIYFYTKSLGNKKIQKKEFLIFIPLVFSILYYLSKAFYIYYFDVENRWEYFNSPAAQLEFIIHDGIAILFNAYFFYKGFLNVIQSLIIQKRNFSTIPKGKNLRWLQLFFIGYAGLLALWMGYHCAEIFIYPEFLFYETYLPLHIVLALFTIYLGYRGLMQPEIFEPNSEASSKYKTSSLDKKEVLQLKKEIIAHVSEKELFLNTELKLSDLSASVGIPSHKISQVLSSGLQTNFYEFINKYRVERFKQLMQSPKYDGYTILGVALEAGFNSKNTFYRAFQEQTGTTPSAFKKGLKR